MDLFPDWHLCTDTNRCMWKAMQGLERTGTDPPSWENAVCTCMLPVEPQARQLNGGREEEHAHPQTAGDLKQIGSERNADDARKRSGRVGDA
eukprot:scaffold1927_cov333-Pavlova_lutheri.AAC.12